VARSAYAKVDGLLLAAFVLFFSVAEAGLLLIAVCPIGGASNTYS